MVLVETGDKVNAELLMQGNVRVMQKLYGLEAFQVVSAWGIGTSSQLKVCFGNI